MSKVDEFVREVHAELAPVEGEVGGEKQTAGARLTPFEIEQIEAAAAVSNMSSSVFIRAAVRRMLRDARKAGLLEQVKA